VKHKTLYAPQALGREYNSVTSFRKVCSL